MSEIYLGNPNLKKANTQIQFSAKQIEEFLKCKNDPLYFTQRYVKIVSLDEGLVPIKHYKFQEKLINTQMFIASFKRPTKAEITAEVQKVYPTAIVMYFSPSTVDPSKPMLFAGQET